MPAISLMQEPTAAEEEALLEAFHAGRFDEAERLARSLTQSFPEHLFGWKVLAATLAASGRQETALGLYERLHSPRDSRLRDDWQFLNNYGNLLKEAGRLDDAARLYRQAIQLDSSRVEPHYNLGLTHIDAGYTSGAEEELQETLRRAPEHGLAHLNLANLFNLCGRLQEAEEHYLRAKVAIGDDAKLENNLGQLYAKLHRYPEAETCYRRAILLDPAYATPVSNLAEMMGTHGLVAEAELLLRHAVALDPSNAQVHSNLLFTLAHRESITVKELRREHELFAQHFETPVLVEGARRGVGERLRLGFVSADLRSHPLLRYLPQVLGALRGRGDAELYAYSNNLQQDRETARYRGLFHAWRDVFHLSDEELAARIRADGIDVLFDLSGHTGHHRLLAFALRPAPVQIGWMGYVGTTGMSAIDYVIGDRFLVPEEHERWFRERLLLLPAATTFQPHPSAPPVNELPALTSGVFTFACLARANKLNPAVVKAWAKVLRGAPASRLVLATLPDGQTPQTVLRWFAEEGFPGLELASRLVFAHCRNVDEQLALQHRIDLALDSFPYTGSTSSSHALWMGVPTLTIAGQTTAGRMGAALALHVGLPEFVARDADDYACRAIAWTLRLDDLSGLRRELRDRFAASALQQHGNLAEALMTALWKAVV